MSDLYTADLIMPTLNSHWPVSRDVARARTARSLAASAIVTGSVDPGAIESYRRWLTISVMLGDITLDEAAASMGRAENVYARNLSLPRFEG